MQASGFAEWPDYRIDVRRIRNLVRVSHDDRHLAETTASLLVAEQDHGIVFYIPVADVRFDLLTLDEQLTSRCPSRAGPGIGARTTARSRSRGSTPIPIRRWR